MTRATNLDHQPQRPSWDCLACGHPWPCAPAKEGVVAETGGGTRLAVMMWAFLEEYCIDAGEGSIRDAFERFIGWTRASSY